MAQALAKRGWGSLACSWIKAHQEGPAQTHAESVWRYGNEKADEHAKAAARRIRQAHIAVADALNVRALGYCAFIKRAHAVMLK
eukprot:14825124-Alexandrium_andersonii.AAC.1